MTSKDGAVWVEEVYSAYFLSYPNADITGDNEEADEVFEIAIWHFFVCEKLPIWQFFDEKSLNLLQ